MDGNRFDGLTRALATGTSRRRVLGSIIGGLAALGVSRRAQAVTCRGAGRQCVQHANSCSGQCDTTNADPRLRYKCVCPPGATDCGGVCTDVLNDAQNRGACGIVCRGGVCQGGSCQPVTAGGSCGCGGDCTSQFCNNGTCG